VEIGIPILFGKEEEKKVEKNELKKFFRQKNPNFF